MDRTRDPKGRYVPREGGFGPPPDDAPRETSSPVSLSQSDIDTARARAQTRAEERATGVAGQDERPDPASLHPMSHTEVVLPPPAVLGAESVLEAFSPPQAEIAGSVHQPAASNSDTPSRGLPKPPSPGKEITGGFGIQTGSEYFALDGGELKAIVLTLAERLKAALDGDLRFGLSVVYPQVKVSLVLTIDGREPDQRARDLTGEERGTGRETLEWNRVLTLSAEVEDSGDTPAGKIRDDFQLRQPGKRIVQSGAARLLVDVPS